MSGKHTGNVEKDAEAALADQTRAVLLVVRQVRQRHHLENEAHIRQSRPDIRQPRPDVRQSRPVKARFKTVKAR